MSIKNIQNILDELSVQADKINEEKLVHLMSQIINSKHIFIAGAGRSGIIISTFANRLIHLGLQVSLISEITKPKADIGDLLIIASGSGETGSLISYATKAKELGIKLALITMNQDSSLSKLADFIIYLPEDTYKLTQPMGSTFEQLSFLIYESLVVMLMKKMNETEESMKIRHANIE